MASPQPEAMPLLIKAPGEQLHLSSPILKIRNPFHRSKLDLLKAKLRITIRKYSQGGQLSKRKGHRFLTSRQASRLSEHLANEISVLSKMKQSLERKYRHLLQRRV